MWATRLWGAAEVLRETIGTPTPPVERAGYERATAAIRMHLGEKAFTAAWTQGRMMTPEQVLLAQDSAMSSRGRLPHARICCSVVCCRKLFSTISTLNCTRIPCASCYPLSVPFFSLPYKINNSRFVVTMRARRTYKQDTVFFTAYSIKHEHRGCDIHL